MGVVIGASSMASAQVGIWDLDGRIKLSGYTHGTVPTHGTLALLPDGTYRAPSTIFCGATGSILCETGRWARQGSSGKFMLTPDYDPGSFLTECLFKNGSIRDANSDVKKYATVMRLGEAGLSIRSVAVARARFAFGWKTARGKAKISGTQSSSMTLEQVVEFCDDGF